MSTLIPQRPSLGRIVHYSRPQGGPTFVGIVVGCRDFVCDLYLLPNNSGMDAMVLKCVAYGNDHGYWHWPEREEPAPDLNPVVDAYQVLDHVVPKPVITDPKVQNTPKIPAKKKVGKQRRR